MPTVFASPSWVETLRSGEVALQVEVNGSLYFRYLQKGGESEEVLCKKSVGENIKNIKLRFPQLANILMKVQLIYFDKKYKDCASTIVIDKKEIEQLHTQAISEYKHKIIKLKKDKLGIVEKAKLRIIQFRLNVKSNVYVGMNIKEVSEIVNFKFTEDKFTGTDICFQNYKSPATLQLKEFTLCWDSFENTATINGICENGICIENNL